MPPDPEAKDSEFSTASERRVRALIDSLVESDDLSGEAKETLRHLRNLDFQLANAEVEDLMELLQEVVS